MNESLEREIYEIRERNKRVETEKAWEVSATRKLSISFITYLTVVAFMSINNFPKPWISSLIPVIGYLASTMTLPVIKKMWKQRHAKS
jgi:hypothetical protein